ncbi:high-affinity branched-chain amino acid transport system permease protein LivH [Variibacter gotjawalensis]|uniref:High-affinity branched-chain amino acid transport system permease protein LivH n=1 Tax=Variibacter gotjawalensis TaxID=1333996 RepID=A0A0S3PZU1_9BRAD|nr:branched-chain amino acid ABC transporter permease [Variibacter gotjawalensis]NIK47086.1 branched-chain amino acid transport system permease protein [Variibacter gotjawalensis]RZS48988.1 amino acid/amide ABC transporter membrane protein 1 (HAAT family) [Variibacter gotjawalensis]BAT61248.1 high-affinity branched-chain amino acid transport system permease protein LivH [Variibacter gotjawalensis]
MDSTIIILAAMDGVAYAALVFLVSVGLSLIFGVLRIVNVAHGSLYAYGAYVAASLALAVSGISPWLTYPALIVASILVGVLIGGAMEYFLLRPVYGREEVLQLLITFAVFMIMDNVQRLIWGVQPISMAVPLTLLPNVEIFGVNYTSYQVILLPAVALLALAGLRYFLRYTLSGAVILAVTEDREAATAIGIDAKRVFLITFIVGASLAALGGALASPTTSLLPGMGTEMIVLSFAVAATAGLGQIEGTAVAALMIGLARAFAIYTYPEFEVLVPYLIMVLVLLIRPQGLFGVNRVRKI